MFSYGKAVRVMQAKLNIVLKLVKELDLTVVSSSPFNKLSLMEETDRLRLTLIDMNDKFELDESTCDELTRNLNEIKKKIFEFKIIESGQKIDSVIELKDLKSRGIDKFLRIPVESRERILAIEGEILAENDYLVTQSKKSKLTIVEENNLLPNLNFRVGTSLLFTLFAGVFVILGYIASTDERFYDKDFGYWSMLLGGLALLVTLNLLVIRVVQAVRFQMNKQKQIDELAFKFISKLHTDFEALDRSLRSKIFGLERVVYQHECRKKVSEFKTQFKELRQKVSNHFE